MAASSVAPFWIAIPYMAVSWMAYLLTSDKSKFVRDFVKFEHVKKFSVILLNLSNPKNYCFFADFGQVKN